MAKLIEITGKALSGEWGTDDIDGTGIPVLRTTNFTNDGIVSYENVVSRTIAKKNIEKKYLKTGDIIIEKSGGSDKQPVGRVVFYDGPEHMYLFNNFTGLLRVKDREKWDPKYIFYSLFFNYIKGGTKAYENKTTGLHNLKTDDYVSKYEVKEIDIERQRAKCKRLDMLYEIIRLQRSQIIKFDELIKSRFVEMFGDPESNPMDWTKVPMGNHITTLVDFNANGSYAYLDSNVTMYDHPDFALMVRTIDLEKNDFEHDVKYIDENAYNILSKSKVYGNEIIMNKIGSAGKVYLMPCLYRPVSLGRNAFMFRFDKEINVVFLFHQLTSAYGEKEIMQHVRGAVTKTITKDAARSVRIIVPPKSFQEDFESFVQEIDKSKSTVQKRLNKLQTLQKSLMQQYFG